MKIHGVIPAALLPSLQEIESDDLQQITGGGFGPWAVQGNLNSSSTAATAGAIGLTYHTPKINVTGSILTNGQALEWGLGAQGRIGDRGQWSGSFSSNGKDWNTSLSYRHRF